MQRTEHRGSNVPKVQVLVSRQKSGSDRELPWTTFRAEFPTLTATVAREPSPGAPIISAAAWRAPAFDPFAFDALIGDAATGPLTPLLLVGTSESALEGVAVEILTRYQGRIFRRNAHTGPRFDLVLAALRRVHDLTDADARANYCHGLDAWQWLLRLDANVGHEIQVAALFLDADRQASDTASRSDRLRDVSELASKRLRSLDFPEPCVTRVTELLLTGETPGDDPARRLLNDADALSFFSLDGPGFLSTLGEARTVQKMAASRAQLSVLGRERLRMIRFRTDFDRLMKAGVGGGAKVQ